MDDEDDEVEEIGSPRKRKRASMDEGGRDKKGKRKMTEADWVLRKIVVCLEGIEEMMEERWYAKETEEKRDADGEEEAEVEYKMVE